MIDYFSVLSFYKAETIEISERKFVFSLTGKTGKMDFWIFKDPEGKLRCFYCQEFSFPDVNDLIYLFESNHSKQHLLRTIALIAGQSHSFDTSGLVELSEKDIKNNFALLEIINPSIHNLSGYSCEVLSVKPFLNKVFIRKDRLVIPLVDTENSVTNLFFVDTCTTINNNPGSFSSWFLPSSKLIAVFFSGKSLLDHGHRYIASEYFYLLLAGNIDVYQLEKIKAYSASKTMPLEIYIHEDSAGNFNQILSIKQFFIRLITIRLLTLESRPFDDLVIDHTDSMITFHFFYINSANTVLQIMDFVKQIHETLIVFFNGELVEQSKDVSILNKLISVSSSNDGNLIRYSISFLYSSESFCLLANILVNKCNLDNIIYKSIYHYDTLHYLYYIREEESKIASDVLHNKALLQRSKYIIKEN